MHYTCAMVSLAQSPPDASHVRASGVILRYDDATCSHIATLDVSHHFDNNFCKHFIYWHVFYPCKLQTCALLLYATRTSGAWGTFVRLTLCTDRAGSNPHTRCLFFFVSYVVWHASVLLHRAKKRPARRDRVTCARMPLQLARNTAVRTLCFVQSSNDLYTLSRARFHALPCALASSSTCSRTLLLRPWWLANHMRYCASITLRRPLFPL